MQLTKNFTLREFTRSQTATRLGIDNTPTPEAIENLIALCENLLQPLRDKLGIPISISSGYRSPKLNAVTRGSKTSQHCSGMAADIDFEDSEDNWAIFHYIKDNFTFDQLIFEFPDDRDFPSWVHVSYSNNNRNQVLKAIIQNGKTTYTNFS